MICYIYDGSFDGLLSCIYEGFYNKKKPEFIVRQLKYQPNFLDEVINIKTNIKNSSKVLNAIKNKIGNTPLNNIYYAYLSEIYGSEMYIFQYLKLGFKVGRDVDLHLYNDAVLNIAKIYKKVTYEALRMKGFIRFKQIKNEIYYSSIEPEHDVLELIISHFCQRFKNENFIIHDIKRQKAALYNKSQCIITSMPEDIYNIIKKSVDDSFYENLWKSYYDSVTIKERINPKLQKRNMPQKYWKHIVEVETVALKL